MSATTNSQYKTRVLERVGLNVNDGMVDDTTLESFLNRAAQKVAALRDWPWLLDQETITSVAGQAEYTPVNAAYRSTVRIEDAYGLYLPQRRPRSMTRWLQNTSDRPFFYTTERGKVILAPTPSVSGLTFTHTFIRNESTLSGNSDTLLIDAFAEDLIVLAAARMIAVRTKDTTLMQLLGEEYAELLSAVQDEVNRSRGALMSDHRAEWGEM